MQDNLKGVEKRVKNIYAVRNDNEMAHKAEDSLHIDFIKHIAKTGTKEQRKMAREILKVDKMDFSRWCS